MLKLTKLHKIIIPTIIIVSLIIIGIILGGKFSKKSVNISSSSLKEKVVSIKELASVEYTYTNIGTFEDNTKFFGFDLPLTNKKFILIYDGKIKAGVDFKDVKIDVKNKNISIHLPEPKILSHETFEDTLKIYDEQSSLFNQIKIKDINDFFIEQKKLKVSRAKENNLLIEANMNAKKTLELFIKAFINDSEYTIDIQTTEPKEDSK